MHAIGERLDGEQGEGAGLAPGEEVAGGTGVGFPCVPVSDGGGEELDEAFGRPVAGVGDDGGQDEAAGGPQGPSQGSDLIGSFFLPSDGGGFAVSAWAFCFWPPSH
jgi:hypothetical protein